MRGKCGKCGGSRLVLLNGVVVCVTCAQEAR